MRGYPEKARLMPEAERLRAQGLSVTEVARRLGQKPGTVRSWFGDPDGSKKRARIESYAGECVDCGAPTSAPDGPGNAAVRCHSCHGTMRHERAKARIIAAIQSWAAEHDGIPPSATDWNPAHAEALGHFDRAQRARFEGWPWSEDALRIFGSWNAAIEAAGFTPKPVGTYGRAGENMALCVEIRERYEAGESTLQLALAYDCSNHAIGYRLRKAGARMRSAREAWQLRRAA